MLELTLVREVIAFLAEPIVIFPEKLRNLGKMLV